MTIQREHTMDKWKGKVAVVTGASAGIGAALATGLTKSGLIVVGLARRADKVETLKQGLVGASGQLHAFECDVANYESVKAAFAWIENTFGGVNILINNAGVYKNVELLDTSDGIRKELMDTLDINLVGLIDCTREAFKIMKKKDDYGYFININSTAGHKIPFSQNSAERHNTYTPSKYAVTALTEVIRQELIGFDNNKIRVSSLSPGWVKTDILGTGGFEAIDDDALEGLPVLYPEDIFQAVLYMLSTPHTVNVKELTLQPTAERY